MESNYLLNNWYSWRLIALCFIIASITTVTGCGESITIAGVGSGGTGTLETSTPGPRGPGTIGASISGLVADGYLEKTIVFLDRNGNYQLDEGEPSTTTDANGAYTLIFDQADIGKYPLVALAIKGVTIDKETNQTVAGSFVLSTPKECVSSTISKVFISPISSLLREMFETGLFTNIQQAKDGLKSKLGLPDTTDILADYISVNNTVMHTVAHNMSILMGNQMAYVIGSSGSTTTVDVNRYRGMMGTIFSNMSLVKVATAQNGISDLNDTITAVVSSIPPTISRPYQDMSTFFIGM
jgi:hypothetical protein